MNARERDRIDASFELADIPTSSLVIDDDTWNASRIVIELDNGKVAIIVPKPRIAAGKPID